MGNTPGDNVMVMPDYGPKPVSGHNLGQANKDAYDAYLREKQAADREKGIYGVPFFEIGKEFISGAQSILQLESVIKSNLS